MIWAIAAAVALAVAALTLNAKVCARAAEKKWPPTGKFVEIDGARIHVCEAGAQHARRVLLIHGASSNLRELWGPLAEPLAASCRVIAYDRPGLGHSARISRAQTLATQARVAARVLGEEPALIVGHSLGAAVALRLALDHPRLVSGLVLIAPASHPYPHDNAWWIKLAAAPIIGHAFAGLIVPALGPLVAPSVAAANFWPAQAPEDYFEAGGVGLVFRPGAFRANAQDVRATKSEFAAQAPRYGDIFAPAIVITAEKDKIVSPKRHARALAAELPDAELVIAPDAGHMPHRLRADLVLAAIRRVNELAAPAAAS
jgi:pimeloyl-ACP methyl ester carboxylesterase